MVDIIVIYEFIINILTAYAFMLESWIGCFEDLKFPVKREGTTFFINRYEEGFFEDFK
jgi:hypothetical protein